MKDGAEIYFFDTYAIIELNKGNPNYTRYTQVRMVTTILNLTEFYHASLKEANKEFAEKKFISYLRNCVQITPEIIKTAVDFRLKYIKETKFKISYIDAIGYVIARKLNIKFLTGDQAFRNLENVAFVP